MSFFTRPLNPVFCFLFHLLALGIAVGNSLPDFRIIASVLFIIVLTIAFSLKPYRQVSLTGLFFLIGFLQFQHFLYWTIPANHVHYFLDKEKYTITGRIVSFASDYTYKQRVAVEINKIKTRAGKITQARGRVYLNIYGDKDQLPHIFDTIRFKSKLRSIRNFNNPGHFDYKRFLLLKKIHGTAYTTTHKLTVIPDINKSIWVAFIQSVEQLRNEFSNFVLKRTGRSDAGKIMVSLVTGKKELISTQMRDLFSRAGISHLLAISGLHLSIIGFLFFHMLYQTGCRLSVKTKYFKFLNRWFQSGLWKKTVLLICLMPLFCYAGFSGFSPSALRAFIMAAVVMGALASENQFDSFSSFGLAGTLILLLDPGALFSISFQLSFMAVCFILCGHVLIKNHDIQIKSMLISKGFMMGYITFFAGLGTLPLTAYYFHQISFVQLITNLFAIPIIGFTVLPLGLLSLILFPLLPEISGYLIWAGHHLSLTTILLAGHLSMIPFAWQHVDSMEQAEVFAYYLLFYMFWMGREQGKKALCLGLAGVILVCGLPGDHYRFPRKEHQALSVTVLDVGQGFCALIQGPENTNILVDGAGFSARSTFDIGRSVIAPFLWQNQVKTLDMIILSHPESDHLNGLVYIVNRFKTKKLLKNGDSSNSIMFTNLMESCRRKGVEIIYPETHPHNIKAGKMDLQFFGGEIKGGSLNDNSLVFRLKYHDFSILFPGDILHTREQTIAVMYDQRISADVLLSPHHGSNTSSSKILLDKVNPESVVISCGWSNRYGFPHPNVLTRYKTAGLKIYRTDLDGAVFIQSHGTGYQIKTYREMIQ